MVIIVVVTTTASVSTSAIIVEEKQSTGSFCIKAKTVIITKRNFVTLNIRTEFFFVKTRKDVVSRNSPTKPSQYALPPAKNKLKHYRR